MGGKPHQSKGCGTCRKRKKGCDQAQPACGQCLKAGIKCAGYVKEIKFINHTSGYDHNGSQSSHSSPSDREVSQGCMDAATLTPMPAKCDKSIARIGWYGSFMHHWSPSNDAFQQVDFFARGAWMYKLPEIAGHDPLVACALDALSLIRLGISMKNNDICAASEHEYLKALQTVRIRIKQPDKSQIAILLAVILVLGNYEIVGLGTNKALGWSSHVHGALALARQHDDVDDYPELYSQIRFGLRLDSIIRAISLKDPTILLNRDWMDISKIEEMSENKTHQLYCILEQMPAVFRQADALHHIDPGSVIESALDLAKSHDWIASHLHDWARRYLVETKQTRILRHPSFRNNTSSHKKQEYIWFSDLESAATSLLMWTGLIQLYVSHIITIGWLRSHLGSPIVDTMLTPDSIFSYSFRTVVPAAEACVRNIELSLEYFVQPEVGSLSSRLIAFPMASAMAWRSKAKQPPSQRCIAALQCLRERDGVPLDTFLQSMLASAMSRGRA